MKLFNRLCIFLLGFVMGIVGCVGGLAGGIYYAYTGLKVEDFTGVLTKDQIPVLDEDSKNFTQMSLEEIINKIMILNNIDEITLGNLETTLGLDLSSLNIPDEVKDWPLSKLWGEGGFEEFAEYVTVGALYDLVTETFGVDWLADNYSELFGEGGKLRNVTLADFLKEDGYINILVDVKIKDLLPASLLESLPDYLRTLIEAIGSVSLGNLLRALIKGDIDVLEVIFNTPEIKELVLSDLFPEVLDPIAKLLEGIKLGDFLYYADGELVFDADVLLKAITIYDILCLAGFANYTPEELLDLLPDGELKDRLSVIMYMSLYQIIYESEVEDYLGDLTIGGIVDAFLELAEASNAISELPEPIPTIWDKIRVIKIIDIVNGIKNENYAFILDDCLYTLTLNDLFGSYLDDELLKQLPEPVPGLWYILKDLTIGFFVNDIASLPDKFVNYTVRDMVGVYFFEGEFKFGENGERYYEYELDENGRPVAKMSEPIGSVFLCIDDITMYEIIMALLCESGLCDHDEGEHFKLEDLLVKYIYPVSIADIFDALLYDKDGNFIAPETVQIIYEAIKDNTIGDIVAVANGEQGYETLLENLYKLCLDDLVGMIIDFDVLPKVLKNIYDKIAYIPIGEIVEDWQVVLRALYTITVDDLVGEFIDRETLYEGLLKLYDCIKDISIQNVIDAVNNKEYYKLYEKFYSLTLLEVVLTEADRESIRTDNEKLYAVLETICGVSVGYIFEFLFCVTGLCETEGIVSPDHEHTGYFGLLDETVFELEVSLLTEITIELIAGSEEDKDMLTDSLSGFIDAVDGMTVGEIFYALIASLGGDELAENLGVQDKVTQNFKELLLKYFGDKSFADIFSHFDKYLMPELFHPLAFALGFVFHVSVNDIIDFTENTNTLKFLDICEKYFYQYIESSYFDKYPEQIPYFNEEYPVSLGFLFGYWYYEMADFVVERTADDEGNPVRGLMNCFDVLFLAYKDITLRDILTNKYALIDGLNHFTMGDFFGELLGFTYENGVWVNPDATATSSALFNAIADITPYDLIFDMDYTMVLYNFRIIDFVNLILDAVDPDRSVYNEVVPEAVREYINNVGQITFGDLIDGNVDPEIFIDSLGDITVGDIVKIFTDILGLTIPDNTLLNKILAVKLIDIARLHYHEIAANFTLYDFVQGILVELCGVELDRNFSIIDWWLNTWATVTVDDFIIFAEDPTAETGEWLVRKLLDGLTVEILADTVCEIIEPYQKHPGVMDNLALWRYISVLEVLDFIYDIDKVEEAVMNGLKETSVGEVIKFVLDLVDETIYDSLPQVLRKIIDNLCQIEFSFYSLITNIIDGPPENYAETLVRAFFNDVDINDFVLLFEEYLPEKLFELELYKTISAILINDILFDQEKVLEQLKDISVGDVARTVLELTMEDYMSELPEGTLTILEALDKLTVAFFTEDLENRDLLKETLSVLFAEVNNGCYIDTILYIIYGSADPDGYDYDKVINILADVFANGYLYDTIYANDLYEFMYGFFGPLTFGGLIGIIDNYEAVSIDGKNLRETVEQVYEQLKLRFLEEIQLALFLSGPTPYEIFGEYTLRDVMGDRIDDIAYLSDIADEKIADLINTYLDFVPERLRVYVVTVVGVAVAVLVYLVYEYDLDTILTELNVEVPEAVRTTKLYSIYAFISLKDVITDWDTVWADIRGTSLGDFVDFVIAVIDPDYTPWPEMQRLIDNLYNITIGDFIDGEKDAEEYVRIALDTITVNLFLSFPPLYDITPEIVRNNGLYEFIAEIPLLELIFDHSALRDRVFAISVADLIIWGLEFADKEPDYSIVLIDKLLTNLDKITIFYIIEEFHWRDCLLKICGDITYRELIEGILDICGLDKNELPEEALFLVDTLLDNCADLYIRGLFEDPMDADWYAALEGVTLGMIFDAAFVLIYPEKEIDPILIENEPFKALRAIYLRDLISDFEGTVKQLADIKIGELIETLIRFFDVESWTSSFETVNKLIENTKDVSIDDIWQAVTGESLLGEYPPLTPFELLEKVLNDISWADVFSDIFLAFETAGIFSLDDAPQEYLPEATKDLIRKMLITNLEDSYVIRIFAENHYFPWYEMLAVTVDETFRGTFGAYIDIPEEVYECPLYVVYADVLIRDLIAHPDVYLNRFKDVTVGSMLIWALDLAGYEILYTNNFETKFVNNLNNITFGYFFDSSFDVLQLMRDIFESITFKDIVDCALDHADVDLAELPDKTEALVRLVIENLDKMPVNNLFEDPVIVPWYDMLEGITIGMIVESIAELVNVTMPEELVNGEPVKTIFAIELRELIDDPAKALEPLAEVALGDIAETFFKLFDAEYLITDYAIIYKLVNNAKNLTVDDLYQIFANETIVEEGPAMNATEFFRILLEDIYLLDVYNTVTSAVGDTLPEEIEKASFFVKVTGISLFDLFFVWDNVYEVIKSINIGETAELPLLLWYPEYDEYTIFDMLVENSRRVTFYALFTETSAEGIENNFKLILEGIQIRHINEFYEAHLPTVLTDSEIYGLVSDLYIARLIFNTRDEFAKLARASIGGILQTFVDIVKLDLSVYTALPVFIDNLKQLTIDHAAQAFFFQRLIAVSDNDGNDNTTGFNATVEAMMSARDFVTLMLFGIDCGMVLEDIYYIGGYTLTDELKATNLYNTLASIPVYSLVDVAEYKPLYENTLKYISVGDVLEIVFIYTPEFEKWPELEKLIDNMDNVNIGLIADAINEEITVQDFLKVAIFGISFKIITQIPAFEEKVPAWINDSSVYNKLTGINIYDVMYDKDAVLEDMKHIYIGEVTELCTEYMLPEWKTYGELVNKLNSNLKTISFYEIYDIFAGGANSLYFDSLGERIIVSITLGDIFDFVCGFRTEAEKYAPLADIIRDAEILALIKTLMSGSGAVGTYRSFMLLLIGDTVTVKDLLLAIEECELADIYSTYDAEYYIGLFDGRKLYYVLTQPTPSVLLGNVTFGMLFGRILGWTPENAEMTVWSGSGIFAEFANTLMVDIVNKTIAKLITDEYLQTVAIILCTAAAFGLYKLYQDNIDTIRDVLNKTVDEILDSLDLIKYKDDPNTKLGAIIYFLSENYGGMTVNEILVLINNKVYIELLRGVTVGEVYDLANILTDGKLDEFVNNAGEWQSNLDAFIAIVKHADIAEVFTAESGESMMLALFGQHTTAEVLGLVRINDKWCFNDKYVFPVQCLADMEFFLVVTIIMRGNIDEITSMLFNWTVMEAYQLFDPNMNKLVGVLGGTLVYKFVYAKANMSVITLISNFANGNFDDVTTVITMGDIKEVLPDNIVEQLGFVVTVFDNNYNVTLKEIIDSKDVVELLLAGIRMGDIMGYTKGACNVTDPGHVHNGTDCQYEWFDKDGNLLDVITNRFANTKLTTLISDDSVTFKTIIGDATLGELLSLTEGADGIWRDQNGVEVDVIRATIAPLLLADIMDNSEIILNAIDVIYIGELMNYTLVAGEWYEADGSKVDTLIAKFADLTIGEIRKGTVDFESLFNNVKLGEVMKYYLYDFGDGNGPVWSYTDSEGNTVPANKIPAAIADLTVGEIIDPAFDFVGFFRSTSLYVGDFMGYYSTTVYNPDTDEYELKWFSDKSFALEYEITDPVEAAFANTSLANLFDPDFDKISIIEDVYIGNLMHYERYDFGDGVVWAKPNGDGTFTQVTDKVIIALADLTLGKVLKDFDISLIVKDMYIGDIIGYTFDGSVWKDTDDNEITNPVTLAFINIRMEALVDKNNPFDFIAVVNDLYLGELMGNIRDPLTGEWYDGDGTPLDNQDKLALALMNTKISDYFGITINFENIFSGLKLGDILGKKEISGIWYESEGVRASSMMNILYGLDLVDLMYYDVSMKETINNMTLAELLDLDPSTTGILGSFMTLKVSELTEDNIRNKINGLTVSDIFTDMTGVLALIPASTTIEELPTALASAVNNATLADLENAGIMVATPAQLDTITDLLNANPNDTTIYTADQLQIMTISELIAKIVEAADGVLTLIP